MTLTHAFPRVGHSVLPETRSDVLRRVAIKVLYFSLVTTVFVFVSILLTGIHP